VYPLGFYLPFAAVPVLGPLGATYSGLVLMGLGLAEVQEIGRLWAGLFCAAVVVVSGAAYYFLSVT
jgi:hypothetical protein